MASAQNPILIAKGALRRSVTGASRPQNIVAPSITGGASVGATLTVVPGTWTGSPSFAYLWFADGVSTAETGSTYEIEAGDEGKVISVRETATNATGSTSALSEGTDPVAPPITLVPPIFVRAVAAGTADGSSFANAVAFTSLNAAIAAAGPDGTVKILASDGPYTAQVLNITNGGTSGHRVTIQGSDSGGAATPVVIDGARPNPWTVGGTTGSEVFRLNAGANYLRFQYIDFTDCGNGCFRFAAPITDIKINDCNATNVQRFIEDTLSGTNVSATVTGLDVDDCTVNGFSRAFARIRYDSSNVRFDNCFADSERQDGDPFAAGFVLDDTAHDVIYTDCQAHNCIQTLASDVYWNADGFSQEVGNTAVQYVRCIASGCTDGGFDLKGSATLTDCLSYDNKHNYRMWTGPHLMTRCVGQDVIKRGGTGNTSNCQVLSGTVTLDTCAFVDIGASTYAFELNAASSVVTGTCSVQTAGQLAHNLSGGSIVGLDATGAEPTNSVLPTITGTPTVGQTLTRVAGTWTGTTTKTQQWLRDGSYILDERGATYVLVEADADHQISVREFAQDNTSKFVGEATSALTAAVTGLAATVTTPSISGTAVTGAVLTAVSGTVTGSPTPTTEYTWLRGALEVGFATTYTVQSADLGFTLVLRQEVTNINGSDSEDSAPTATVTAPVAITRYFAPTVQGAGTGVSVATAYALSSLPSVLSSAGAGSTMRICSHLGSYTITSMIQFNSSGDATSESKTTIEGWNGTTLAKPTIISNRNAWTLPADPEQSTDIRSWADGSVIFRFNAGCSNLIWRYLNFERCGNGCFYFANDADGFEFDEIDFYNVQRFLEQPSTAALTHFTVSNITGVGFSECFLRIRGTSSDWTVSDCTMNAGRQDGDNFCIGIQCDDSAHDISMYRCIMRNCHDQVLRSSTDYWNSDGFSGESTNSNFYLEDCESYGHTDAGFDFKVTDIVLVRCIAGDNKKNFKQWYPASYQDCESYTPHKRGGSSAAAHLECPGVNSKILWDGGVLESTTGEGNLISTVESTAKIILRDAEVNGEPFTLNGPGYSILINPSGDAVTDPHADSVIPTYIASDSMAATANSIFLDWPANEGDDIAIAVAYADNTSTISFPTDDELPFLSWNMEDQVNVGSAFAARLAWTRVPGRVVGQLHPTAGSGTVMRQSQLHIFDGVTTTGNPYEGYAVNSGTDNSLISPATVVTGSDRRVVRIYVYGDNTSDGTLPAGWTENHAITTSQGNDGAAVMDSKGDVDAGTEASTSRTAGSTNPFVVFSFALIPATATPDSAPVNIDPPSISGNAVEGETLTADPGVWSGTPAPSFSYVWRWDNQNPTPTTTNSATYVIQAADVGHEIKVSVTATNPQGSISIGSAFTATVLDAPDPDVAPEFTIFPFLSGLAQQDATLTCTTGTAEGNPAPAYTRQWKRDANTTIGGATGSSYVLQAADVTHTVHCDVTAANGVLPNAVASSNFTATISAAPVGTNTYLANTGCTYALADLQTPAAIRTSDGKTWVSWEHGSGQTRRPWVRVWNNSGTSWSSSIEAGTSGLSNDDHGMPVLCEDHQGYVHIWWGMHAGTSGSPASQPHASTNSPLNPAAWTNRGAMHTVNQKVTYPEPVALNNKLYVFHRDTNVANQMRLCVTVGTPSSGDVTWGPLVPLATFGSFYTGSSGIGTRFYKSLLFIVGSEIYIMGNMSDYNNTSGTRRGSYIVVYNTLTGGMRNAQNTFSVSAGTIISRSQMDANFRIADQSGTAQTAIFDNLGNLFLWYNEYAGGSFRMTLPVGTTTWTGPVADSNYHRQMWRITDGRIQYLSESGNNFFYRTRSSGGVWSNGPTVFTKERTTTVSNGFAGEMRFHAKRVFNGTSGARAVIGEASNIGGTSTSSTHPNAGDENNTLRVYLLSDTDIIRAPTG